MFAVVMRLDQLALIDGAAAFSSALVRSSASKSPLPPSASPVVVPRGVAPSAVLVDELPDALPAAAVASVVLTSAAASSVPTLASSPSAVAPAADAHGFAGPAASNARGTVLLPPALPHGGVGVELNDKHAVTRVGAQSAQ
jgi:hypothetical protein